MNGLAVPLVTSEAIVLEVTNLHERDRIVALLTRSSGKKRGVARGARTKHSRFAGQLQPLAKLRVTWFEKEGHELVRVSAAEMVRGAGALTNDLEGLLLASYLADHMAQFAQENEPTDHLYRLLDSTVEALLAGVDRRLAARYFECWILRLSGIFPPPRSCPLCGGELPARGAVLPAGSEALICAACAGGADREMTLSAAELDFLLRISAESLGGMAERPPLAATLERIEELTSRVRCHFLTHELASYRVMRRTLAGAGLA